MFTMYQKIITKISEYSDLFRYYCLPDVQHAVLLLPLAVREEVVELLLVEFDEGHADAHVDLARPPRRLGENVLKRFKLDSCLTPNEKLCVQRTPVRVTLEVSLYSLGWQVV